MTTSDHERITGLFAEACTLPPERWESFLAAACPGDENAALRAEVRSLLNHDTRATPFLDAPIGSPGAALRLAESALGNSNQTTAPIRIAGYTVQRLLGVGGMGAVYEARQQHPDRLVALKLMRLGVSSPKAALRFEQEATLLGRLRHPSIAAIYEAGVHQTVGGPTPFFAMEYVEGGRTITAYAQEHALSLDDRLRLFLQVCEAVHYGHQHAIIHRDLKPANILVDAAGRAKVIDFGVAIAADSSEPLTTLHSDAANVVGTLAYMSPEQASGASGPADIRTDVYALGVVLYELLCNKLPYDLSGMLIAAVARTVMDQPPVRPSSIVPALRGDLETIALKAIAKERGARYQSALALADDLRRFLDHRPVEARPTSALYQVRLFARRNRPLVLTTLIALVSVVVVLLGATAVSLRFAWLAQKRADQAEHARARAARVAQFLHGALGSANPFVPSRVAPEVLAGDFEPWDYWRQNPWAFAGRPGEKATVRDVLLAAAARLDTEFADDPLTRADLAQTIGSALFSLREYQGAGPLLESALALHKETVGDDDERTIRTSLVLADLCDNDSRPQRGAELYRAALQSCRLMYGRFDPRSLQVERSLAHNERYLLFTGQTSINRLSETLALAERDGRADSPAMYQHLAYLATITPGTDRQIELATRAMEGARRTSGERSVFTAFALQMLAEILLGNGRPDEAAVWAAQALPLSVEAFGEQSLETTPVLAVLSGSLLQSRRFAEAAPQARQLFEINRRLRGHDDWETHTSRVMFLRCAVMGRALLDDAAVIGAEAVDFLRRQSGPGLPPLFWATAVWHARVLHALGRTAESLQLLDELSGPAHDPDGAMEPEIRVAVLLDRSRLLVALDRRDEARVDVEECLRLARDPSHPFEDFAQSAEVLRTSLDDSRPVDIGRDAAAPPLTTPPDRAPVAPPG